LSNEPPKLSGSFALALTQRYICLHFAKAVSPGSMIREKPNFSAIEEAVGQGPKLIDVDRSSDHDSVELTSQKAIDERVFERAWYLKNRLRPETVKSMIRYAPRLLGFARRLVRLEELHKDGFKDTDYVATLFASLYLLETVDEKTDVSLVLQHLARPQLRWAPQGNSIALPRIDSPFDPVDSKAASEFFCSTESDRDVWASHHRSMFEPLRFEVRTAIIDALPQGDPIQDLRYMFVLLTENGELPPGAAMRWAIDFATCIFCNQTLLMIRLKAGQPIAAERARFVLHSAEMLFGEPSQRTPGIAFDLTGISLLKNSVDKEVRINSLQMNLAAVRGQFRKFFDELRIDIAELDDVWDLGLKAAPDFMKRGSTKSRMRSWRWWRTSRIGRALIRLANVGRTRSPHRAAGYHRLSKMGMRVLSALGVARMVNLKRFDDAVREIERETAAAARARRANGGVLTYDDLCRLAEHRREILRRNGLTE
jgi:hypothetical protein